MSSSSLILVISIHTPTKGVTIPDDVEKTFWENFNPHSHEGSDLIYLRKSRKDLISIHTPTKGVTVDTILNRIFADISIHTPTKGVTIKKKEKSDAGIISIHTPTKGVTIPDQEVA